MTSSSLNNSLAVVFSMQLNVLCYMYVAEIALVMNKAVSLPIITNHTMSFMSVLCHLIQNCGKEFPSFEGQYPHKSHTRVEKLKLKNQ